MTRKYWKTNIYLWAFTVLIALYIILTFMLPVDPKVLSQYQVSQTSLRLIVLPVLLPVIAVYYTALYGFLRFRRYADSVKNSVEGSAFNNLAHGLMVLAFSLPVTSLFGSLTRYATISHPGLTPTATIAKNYLALAFQLLTFFYLVKGTDELVKTLKKPIVYPPNYSLLFIVLFTSLYTWLATTHSFMLGTVTSVYYLPNWLIIFTLVVPYVFIWLKGLLVTWKLFEYHRQVKGRVYRQAFRYLSQGMGCIILLSICIQLLSTLNANLQRLSLQPVLLILYILVAFYALGYGLVARGAKKLKLIEEV